MHKDPGSKTEIIVVIPVFNHGSTLRSVVEGAMAVHDCVLVVDDGSTDNGAEAIADLDIIFLQHPKNLGKGVALQTAASHALKLGKTHMITIDADGQHRTDEIPLFINEINKNPEAVIIGKRDFENSAAPESSIFGCKFSNFWLRLQTGIALGDSQSGFRAYPLFLFEKLGFLAKRYAFETEVLVKSAWAGLDLIDLDISVYYPPKEERISHIRGFYDYFILSVLNFHLTMRSVTPWPHKKIVADKSTGEKISVLKPTASIRMLLTENTTPHKIALAGALGVFWGTLPLIALHSIAILFAAGFFRLNKVAALAASQLCVPPFVPALCIEVGYYIRNGRFLTEISIETIGHQALDRVLEWLIGSLFLAPVLAAIAGGVIFILAVSINKNVESMEAESTEDK